MSAPDTKSFANQKSAKKGSDLSSIGRGVLQIEPFCLPAFIFSDEELEDTLLGLDPLTEHGCTAIFTHQSFHLYHKTNPEPILSGYKKTNQKAWRVQIQQKSQSPESYQHLSLLRHLRGSFKAPDKQTTNMCNSFTLHSDFLSGQFMQRCCN